MIESLCHDVLDCYTAHHYRRGDLPFSYISDVILPSLECIPFGKVLDLASGKGGVAEIFHRFGFPVVNLDISRLYLKAGDVQGNIARLPFCDASFKTVHTKDSLVHVDNQQEYFKEIARVLSKNGKLILSSIEQVGGQCIFVGMRDRKGKYCICEVDFEDSADYMAKFRVLKRSPEVISVSSPYFSVSRAQTLSNLEKAGFKIVSSSNWQPGFKEADWYAEPTNRFVYWAEKM